MNGWKSFYPVAEISPYVCTCMSVTLYKDNTYQVYIRNERGKVYIYHVYIRKLREVRDITLHCKSNVIVMLLFI